MKSSLLAAASVVIASSFTALFGATPPSDLLGNYLYFEAGPDDFLVFTDGTNGEEQDVAGGVDAFTYTYTVTGANTASLVVTYDPVDMDFDEWDLTYTANGTGSFVRREFKDNALKDTDTGNFQEDTGEDFPPTDLIGARLEEAIVLERERFEFLTETDGRDFEPGDVDLFTYVYTVTGADTASITATFKPGDRWVELDLTFVTEDTGTYLLSRFDDALLKDEKRGEFLLDRNTQVVDLAVGLSARRLKGDDFFNASGKKQTARTVAKDGKTVRVLAVVENDGNDDSLLVKSSKGTRKFDVKYFGTSPRKNLTGAISRGRGLNTGLLSHDEKEKIMIMVTPKRSRGSLTLRLKGASKTVAGARDQAKVQVKAK